MIFKLFSDRDDFCVKYNNLIAPHMRERIMMQIVKFDGDDLKNSKPLGTTVREVLGTEFANARRTKVVSDPNTAMKQMEDALYKKDQSAGAIPPPPGVVFDADISRAETLQQHLQGVFDFEARTWAAAPVWSDIIKLSTFIKGSTEHIADTKAFLLNVGSAVSVK